MKALIVVDMLEEFVDGRLGSDKSRAIVPNVAALANHAQAEGWQVVFANDAHQPGDPEIALWGEHAIHDTPEAGLATELLVRLDEGVVEGAVICRKTEYDAFAAGNARLGMPLAVYLGAKGITEVVIVGAATHICVAQTAIGAFQQGFDVTVVADAVAGFEDTDEAFWLNHIRTLTGAKVPFAADILNGVIA
jgi:nicotinamidase-related amidase